jgi:hypothetical protein
VRGNFILWQITGMLLCAGGFTGCASFNPKPMETAALRGPALVEERGEVRVRARMLSQAEIRQHFDTKLWKKQIQPIWIEVENNTDHPLWLLKVGVDRDYYPTSEAAYRSHRFAAPRTNQRINEYFRANELSVVHQARSTNAGVVYAGFVRDAKAFNVELLGRGTLQVFHFAQETPGFEADFNLRQVAQREAEMEARELTLEELRAELEGLPSCTTDAGGQKNGDPLNIVMIGSFKTVLQALVRCGWHLTEPEGTGVYWRTFKAFLFGKQYQSAPVSHLYALGRAQDVALQKPRHSIKQRNHMRLWLTPYRLQGKPVWLGQISRDTGVRFTPRMWHLSTHKIAPDVDEARAYLVSDLLLSQALDTVGWVKGVGATDANHARKNLTEDMYYSDGLRVVLLLSPELVDVQNIQRLDWELPPLPPIDVNALEKSRGKSRQP